MHIWIGILVGLLAVTVVLVSCVRCNSGEPANVLRHVVQDITGLEVDLSRYRGQVVLVVNVASKCGFTPQYEALENLYQKYKENGFVILGFPANDFLGQEPGSNEEIAAFCRMNYGVTFPMFARTTVTGRNKAPLYQDLVSRTMNPRHSGGIKWNFTKFLLDRNGRVVDRFAPTTAPDNARVVAAIEEQLDVSVPANEGARSGD